MAYNLQIAKTKENLKLSQGVSSQQQVSVTNLTMNVLA